MFFINLEKEKKIQMNFNYKFKNRKSNLVYKNLNFD